MRRTFRNKTTCVSAKKILLIRSILTYCSPLWRPHRLGDIKKLEQVQRRATKYILSDYTSDYKTRLVKLDLLPLMHQLELADIMFCVKSLQNPSPAFNILDYIKFSNSSTRSGSASKLVHVRSANNTGRHSYFLRLPRLWNSLPPIDLSTPTIAIKSAIVSHFHHHFQQKFDHNIVCT